MALDLGVCHIIVKDGMVKGVAMEGQSVLVIEDNALNMKLITALLTIGNYHILEAFDAETGIQMAKRHQPDIIIMDIQLPGMDGLEATRELKRDTSLKDIPIIALTSYAMKRDEEQALKAGCDAFISKPFDTRNFLEQLGALSKKIEKLRD